LIAISKSQEKRKKAQEEWKKYVAFLEANYVDPEILKIQALYSNICDVLLDDL
jgi:N-dimethylarginine dimethylaminohydrolase